MMEVTFLVGNGFDLNLGLKTSYRDFVAYYTDEEQSKNDNIAIEKFKRELKHTFKKNLWADLELFIGEYSDYLIDEEEYSDCLIDISEKLAVYLEKQQNGISNKMSENMADEFFERLKGYLRFQMFPNYFNDELLENGNLPVINFIDFNYTKSLEICIFRPLQMACFAGENVIFEAGKLVHIHGTTQREMILGVDNDSQIKNLGIFKNNDNRVDFIKSESNEANNKLKVELCRGLLNNSDVIYVYGMSLGATDACWWKCIADRLERSYQEGKPARLVLDMYEPKFKPSPVDRNSRRLRKKWRDLFLSYSDIENEVLKGEISKNIYFRFDESAFQLENSPLENRRDEVLKKIEKAMN